MTMEDLTSMSSSSSIDVSRSLENSMIQDHRIHIVWLILIVLGNSICGYIIFCRSRGDDDDDDDDDDAHPSDQSTATANNNKKEGRKLKQRLLKHFEKHHVRKIFFANDDSTAPSHAHSEELELGTNDSFPNNDIMESDHSDGGRIAISHVPKEFVWKNHQQCSICLTPYRPGQSVVSNSGHHCSHTFHESCIIRFFIQKPQVSNNTYHCPCCQHIFCKLDPDPRDIESSDGAVGQ